MFDELLKGANTRIGNFFDNQFDRLDQFGSRLKQSIPGNIVRGVPDVQRVMLREPQQSDQLQQIGNAVRQGSGSKETQTAKSGSNDKITIKKELPDGRKVTINVDVPNDNQQQGQQVQGQIPQGTNQAMNYFKDKVPPGQEISQAFPILGDEDFMRQVAEADKLRPGLANFLLMQAFFESTLGRNTPNIFGVKPGGQSKGFESPSDALQYQLGSNVLGGGAGDKLNILNTQEPLTEQDIRDLYKSYDPPGAYIDNLLSILSQ